MRTIKELNLCDDFLFHEVMMDENIARQFLETVLDIKIGKIVYSENEKTIRGGYTGKSVRLDIYLEDGENTVYNIEMQNGIQGNLPKRSRKYSAQIDGRILKAGEDYSKLKRQIVIFICTFDPFGRGAYRYTFGNICYEIPGLELGDETRKVFLNTKGTRGIINDELKAFLNFVENSTPENAELLDSSIVNEIVDKVTEIKQDKEMEGIFMTFEEKLEEVKSMVREETWKMATAEKEHELKQKDYEYAQKLKRKCLSIEEIEDITGLSQEEIKSL